MTIQVYIEYAYGDDSKETSYGDAISDLFGVLPDGDKLPMSLHYIDDRDEYDRVISELGLK